MLVCVVLSCLFLVALWSPAGKGLTSWLSSLLRFVTFQKCVLVHIRIKGEVGAMKLTVSRRYFFCGSFVLFMSCVCYTFASDQCCLVVTCWERADLLAVVYDVCLCFCHFPMWYPRSGVVLDCIDS